MVILGRTETENAANVNRNPNYDVVEYSNSYGKTSTEVKGYTAALSFKSIIHFWFPIKTDLNSARAVTEEAYDVPSKSKSCQRKVQYYLNFVLNV